MSRLERQQSVLELLKNLRGLDPLKKLFWSELNYKRVNQSLSRRDWPTAVAGVLADDPVLFAGGGQDEAFHVIYARLASEHLRLGDERPVVSRLLKEHPYALFAFSNSSQDRWHFLNVKYDDKAEKRRLFRRITVGPGERLRTTSERMAMLDLASFSDTAMLTIQERHDEAFDVEAVQKDFFKIFAELYHKVVDDISKVRGLEKEAGKLAQLLLDRMLFLYFIQKKGWLDQRSDYLYSRFLDCWKDEPKGHSYYSNVLYPLFLNLSNADTKIDSVGAVPFLNGGLFEESTKQTQATALMQVRLQVKNATFKAIFDDLLERFNFTVTEDTPLDVEVAIDPEMLGKIFESLILQLEKDPHKDLRKLTGSYYTPRSIVHFMCQEALKEYLVTQLSGNNADMAEVAREKVGRLLMLPPADHLDDEQTRVLTELFMPAEAKMLRQAILDCRICDPAVGSGAFPVGMLHEMVATVARLDLYLHGKDALMRRNYDYDLKKQIIESCLYGVDIQEQAIRLCELRLWLSLVVDYQIDPSKPFSRTIREVPCLPNLSYRIMRGDSLLERLFGHVVQLDEMAKDAKTRQLIGSIQADKQAYFREGNTEEKRRIELKILVKQADLAERLIEAKQNTKTIYQTNIFGEGGMTSKERKAKAEHEDQSEELTDLKKKVADAKAELERLTKQKVIVDFGDLDILRRKYFHTGSYPTFMWRVDFAEVFGEKGGFDVVIGNPPYNVANKFEANLMKVDTEQMKRDPGLAPAFGGVLNLYRIFLLRGVSILRPSGCQCMIVQCAVMSDITAGPLREYLFKRIQLIRVDAFPERDNERVRLFESAKMSTAILVLRNIPGTQPFEVRAHYAREVLPTIPCGAMTSEFVRQIDPDTFGIPLLKGEETEIFAKAMKHTKLSLFAKCYTGEIDLTLNRKFITSNPSHARMVKGAEVQRYYFAKQMTQGEFEYIHAKAYLSANSGPKSVHHKRSRIVMQGITGVNENVRLKMALLDPPAFCGNSVNYLLTDKLPCDVRFFLGVLNSFLLNWLFKKRSTNSNVNGYEIDRLPIVIPDQAQQDAVVNLVEHRVRAVGDTKRCAELDRQINNVVYQFYGLSAKDIAIVESA